jgi:glycosyltransferase involved in cell wall biosynthesis
MVLPVIPSPTIPDHSLRESFGVSRVMQGVVTASFLMILVAIMTQVFLRFLLCLLQHDSGAPKESSRVLIVANRIGELNGETGGGSIFRHRLFELLSRSLYSVTCLSIGRANVNYSESVRGPLMSPSIRNLWLTAQLVSKHDLVIISGSWSFLNVFAVYMGLLCGTPCVTFVTMNSTAAVDVNFAGAMWWLSYVLYMATDYFNCWFSVGPWTRSAEYLRFLSARHIPVQGVVYCGDQYKTFQVQDSETEIYKARQLLCGGQPQCSVLLYCGRLLPEKRIPLLVAAKPERVSLAIVGTGCEAEWLRSIHDPQKGIVCLVDGMVSQENLRKFYKAADIHVSASDFETLGNTVHEALLCGCPVVVQRAGGYVSQVANGKNGFLVDWSNVEEAQAALASVLRKELMDIKPLHRVTSDAQDIVKSHISKPVPLAKRILATLMAWPVVIFLWLLSLMYDSLAAHPKRNEWSA